MNARWWRFGGASLALLLAGIPCAFADPAGQEAPPPVETAPPPATAPADAAPAGPALDLKGMHKDEIGTLIAMWMDKTDRARMLAALEENEKAKWQNKETNATYSIAFAESRDTPDGPCRDFVITAKIAVGMLYIGGACRKPDGIWSAY